MRFSGLFGTTQRQSHYKCIGFNNEIINLSNEAALSHASVLLEMCTSLSVMNTQSLRLRGAQCHTHTHSHIKAERGARLPQTQCGCYIITAEQRPKCCVLCEYTCVCIYGLRAPSCMQPVFYIMLPSQFSQCTIPGMSNG